MESQHPTLQDTLAIPDEFEDPNHHRALAFDYLVNAYDVFLGGSDVFDEQKRALEERYGMHGLARPPSLS
jgi:kinetochore protein NDC80